MAFLIILTTFEILNNSALGKKEELSTQLAIWLSWYEHKNILVRTTLIAHFYIYVKLSTLLTKILLDKNWQKV